MVVFFCTTHKDSFTAEECERSINNNENEKMVEDNNLEWVGTKFFLNNAKEVILFFVHFLQRVLTQGT